MLRFYLYIIFAGDLLSLTVILKQRFPFRYLDILKYMFPTVKAFQKEVSLLHGYDNFFLRILHSQRIRKHFCECQIQLSEKVREQSITVRNNS